MRHDLKYLIVVSVLVLTGAGCETSLSTGAGVEAPAPASAPSAKEPAGTFMMGGAKFRAARPDWIVIQESDERVAITTSTSPHVVKLVAKAQPVSAKLPDPFLKKDGVEITSDFCAPSWGCYTIVTAKGMFEIVWDSESTQQPPENLDGVWSPDVNFGLEDIRAIMLTAEPAP